MNIIMKLVRVIEELIYSVSLIGLSPQDLRLMPKDHRVSILQTNRSYLARGIAKHQSASALLLWAGFTAIIRSCAINHNGPIF